MCVLLALIWTFLPDLVGGDVQVSCVFMESCMLPCSFWAGTDVIHWIQETTGNTPVHSYYHNQDQLTRQDQRFRGRTSLFKDQISRGNASLQLTGVEVQDQGRYKCYTSNTSGNKESFINLTVDAPVRKVDIEQVENRITCSSEGIYPEPELTWSTNPPSNVAFKNTTTVQQTEQQLYNISSSLILSDNVTDLVYSCNVSTRTNWMTNTFKPERPADEETPTNTGVIVGVIIAILFVVGVLAVVVVYKMRQRSDRNRPSHSETSRQETTELMEVTVNDGDCMRGVKE